MSILFCLCLTAFNLSALTVGTYSSPPFSMNEDGEDIGLATEAVRDLLAKSGITDYKIINYPLARGLAELDSGRVDILYPYVTTTNTDKKDYILIGPISKYKVALFVRKDYPLDVSIAAMKNLVVGTERGSISDTLLAPEITNLEQTTQELSCLKMVVADRLSACALGVLPGMYVSAINNMFDQVRYVETNLYADMYVALGPGLPENIVTAIQDTFKKLKQSNYFEKKQKDYEQKFNIFIKSMA